MEFNDYWKKKVTKRRKVWASKSKRYVDNHYQLEEIRKEAYLPLDFNANFNFDDLIPLHFTEKNPIIKWNKGVFSFSEEGMRAAMSAQGADMGAFRMDIEHESIKGKAAPLPEDYFGLNKWDDYPGMKPNKVYGSDRFRFQWLLRMYSICTEMETVRLAYKQASMTIRRYSNADRPFGYYEINPLEQLCHSAILLQESDFYTLDVATLLMDMAGELELRDEELNYFAKKLKLRSMEAATTDTIDFAPWDEKKTITKTEEYIANGYDLDKVIQQLLRPWKSSVKKYFDTQTENAINENVDTFEEYNYYWSSSQYFIEKVFRPFIEMDVEANAEIVVNNPYDITIKVPNSQCRIINRSDGFFLVPDDTFSCLIKLSYKTPMKAVSDYLKMMPAINSKAEEMVVPALHQYDHLVLHSEKYNSDRELLEGLAEKFAGKPVGKMMKYLKWHISSVPYHTHWIFPTSSIKILSDTAFSYRYEGKTIDRWLDAECHTIYASDPATADENTRGNALSPSGYPRPDLWSMTVEDFIHWFFYFNSLSIDYIDKYL